MSVWSFEEIAREADGRWLIGPGSGASAPVGAAIDSRSVEPGQMFIAFRGEFTDGHRHILNAQQRGASLVIVTDSDAVAPSVAVPVLVVADAVEALTRLAVAWRSKLDGIAVVGVTGSNGKTTTCRMLHGALTIGGGLPGRAPEKSFNNQLGVPITVLNARPDDRVLVCELGMSTPGEISERVAVARPTVAVITGIAAAHTEGVGSIEGVAREKASIAGGLCAGDTLVMPSGIGLLDDAIEAMGIGCRVVRVGTGSDAEERFHGVATRADRVSFEMAGSCFTVPMPGVHNASNAALAVVVARTLGVSDEKISDGLARMTAPPMRLERIELGEGVTVINDAYNANPGSMQAALAVLADQEPSGRRVAVLGDMLELGGAADEGHRAVLTEAEELGIEHVWTVGPCFARAGAKHASQTTDDDTIAAITDQINAGDTVLAKGSRGIGLERVVDALRARFGERLVNGAGV